MRLIFLRLTVVFSTLIAIFILTTPGEAMPTVGMLPSPNPRAYPIAVSNPDNQDYSSCIVIYIVNYLVPGGLPQTITITIPSFSLPKNTSNRVVGHFDSLAFPNSTITNGPIVWCLKTG
jgi:hypothetical protein